jgi:NADPH-dependent glutamate synthase beta subunit-like oxidoreductase
MRRWPAEGSSLRQDSLTLLTFCRPPATLAQRTWSMGAGLSPATVSRSRRRVGCDGANISHRPMRRWPAEGSSLRQDSLTLLTFRRPPATLAQRTWSMGAGLSPATVSRSRRRVGCDGANISHRPMRRWPAEGSSLRQDSLTLLTFRRPPATLAQRTWSMGAGLSPATVSRSRRRVGGAGANLLPASRSSPSAGHRLRWRKGRGVWEPG